MSAEELPGEAEIEHAVGVRRLLADHTLLSILVLLSRQELSVGPSRNDSGARRPPSASTSRSCAYRGW